MSTESVLNPSAQVERAQEAVGEYYEAAREKVEDLTTTVEKLIRDQPTQALLVAAGVGFVLGACWMRR